MGNIFNGIFSKKPTADADATTARREAEQAKIVIDTISNGVAVVDAAGLIKLFNPAAATMTGWAVKDALSLDYHSLFHLFGKDEHELAEENNPIALALKTGQKQERDDLYLATNSGQKILISLTATPIRETITQDADQARANAGLAVPVAAEQTRTVGAVITWRDITREKADQNSQTEFISTASHEMRTPVAIIEGYLGMLLNPATATVDARGLQYAQKAHEAAQHLGRLFQDLLDVTKADDNRMNTHNELIDVGQAVRQVAEEFAQKAVDKGLRLSLNGENLTAGLTPHTAPAQIANQAPTAPSNQTPGPTNLAPVAVPAPTTPAVAEPSATIKTASLTGQTAPEFAATTSVPAAGGVAKTLQPVYIIWADLDQLNEILDNLIENAIKYTKQGGVSIAVTADDQLVRITVKDSGIGIPREDVPHLFQKFYRVDNSDTREIGGTGLGLYLTKKLTENLGGQIGLDSDYGQGSTFWVEFPRLSRDAAIAKAQSVEARS